MLLTAKKLGELSFSSLMEVYMEGNLEKAREEWPNLPQQFALQQAEQEFYLYLKEVFFRTEGACYWVWVEKGKYVSALRLEPYRDGLLLEALETHPEYRRQGYGKTLVQGVLAENPGKKIYSHIHKKNLASIGLHEACGFEKLLDYAAYIDGSVNYRAWTYCKE